MSYKFIVPLLVFLCAAGCSPKAETKFPERILSLSAAATHILTELGAPPAAIDEYGVIAAKSPAPPVIGKGSAVSREKIAEYGIDGALVWHYQKDAAKQFRAAGLFVEEIAPLRLADYPELILRLGRLTKKTEQARKFADSFRQELTRISQAGEEPPRRVCFELYSPGKIAGDESYLGDLLRAAGGKSIVAKTGLTGTEYITESNPDVIFFMEGFGHAEEISGRPGYAAISAVRNGKVYSIPRRLTVEGLAPLEAIEYLKQRMR